MKELLAKRRALADEVAPGRLALAFGEAPLPTPPCAKEAPDGETKDDKIRPRHVRKNAPREISYAALPREHVQHELCEAERVCPVTGKALVVVGEKTTEELEYRPGKLVVLVHHRAVYGLCEADREERTAELLVAPAPLRPIENGLAGAALLAWILVQKYCHHLPLYRQQAIFQREGLELPRQTLCDWVLTSAYSLSPIQRALQRDHRQRSGAARRHADPVPGRQGCRELPGVSVDLRESAGGRRGLRLRPRPRPRARRALHGQDHRGLPRGRRVCRLRSAGEEAPRSDRSGMLGPTRSGSAAMRWKRRRPRRRG